jgi:hypothetical protein
MRIAFSAFRTDSFWRNQDYNQSQKRAVQNGSFFRLNGPSALFAELSLYLLRIESPALSQSASIMPEYI